MYVYKIGYSLTTTLILFAIAAISGCNFSSGDSGAYVSFVNINKGGVHKNSSEREAKSYVGGMNRAQQANFIENNQFVTNISDLGIGVQPETDNYTYKIIPQFDLAKGIMHIAQAKRPGLKSYIGIVLVNSDDTTLAKLCETEKSLSQPPQIPELSPGNISCPSGFTALK